MKRYICLTLSFLFIFLMCACEPYEYIGKNPELFTVAIYNIIGGDYFKHAKTSVIETDDYGRVLYKYNFYCDVFGDISGGNLVGLCVSQLTRNGRAYFYEDFCVAVLPDDGKEPSGLLIADLKEQNDWDEPLNEEKMSSRPIAENASGRNTANACSEKIAEYVFLRECPQPEERIVQLIFVSSDDLGKSLFYVRTYDESSSESNGFEYHDSFAIIINADGSYDTETFMLSIDNVLYYQHNIHELKQANGWRFK